MTLADEQQTEDVADTNRVSLELNDGVVVVAPRAPLDDDLVAEIIDAIPNPHRGVVVDLKEATLLAPDEVNELIGRAGGGPLCISCERVSGRALLDRWGIASQVAVFGSVGDALQARQMSDHGYGTGWD